MVQIKLGPRSRGRGSAPAQRRRARVQTSGSLARRCCHLFFFLLQDQWSISVLRSRGGGSCCLGSSTARRTAQPRGLASPPACDRQIDPTQATPWHDGLADTSRRARWTRGDARRRTRCARLHGRAAQPLGTSKWPLEAALCNPRSQSRYARCPRCWQDHVGPPGWVNRGLGDEWLDRGEAGSAPVLAGECWERGHGEYMAGLRAVPRPATAASTIADDGWRRLGATGDGSMPRRRVPGWPDPWRTCATSHLQCLTGRRE